MFNRKSQEIKELKSALLASEEALEKEHLDNVLWASTLRNYVRERDQWDKEARKWEERYHVAESQLESQRNFRTRDWSAVGLGSIGSGATLPIVDDCSCAHEGACDC